MKCRYKYCKNGGVVEKDEAIKVGSSYFCKECHKEKEDKIIISNMVYEILPHEIKMNVNKCIVDWVNKKNFNTEYIIYILDYIKQNRCSIRGVFGIIYYLNNSKLLDEYNTKKTMIEYKTIARSTFNTDSHEVKFTYKSDTGEGWCKIL